MNAKPRTREAFPALAAVVFLSTGALLACAGSHGVTPELRIAPAPLGRAELPSKAAPPPSVTDCFAASVRRASGSCAFSVRESEAMDFEASSSRTFCFDRELNPVMLQKRWSSDAGGGSQTFVMLRDRLHAAQDIEGSAGGPDTEDTYCEEAGGEEDVAGEIRPLSPAEIRALVDKALQELERLDLPETEEDGTCSDSPVFESVCFTPDSCYTPTRGVEVSPELCGKVEELQARLSAISRPD